MKVYNIGTNGKDAKKFFEILEKNKVRKIIDIRLNNINQLCGFTKKNDLEFFLKKISNIQYEHILEFAPTKEILDGFKKKKITWNDYEREYKILLEKREIKNKYKNYNFDNICFLCSEETNEFCHRRLLSEYLFSKKEIINL